MLLIFLKATRSPGGWKMGGRSVTTSGAIAIVVLGRDGSVLGAADELMLRYGGVHETELFAVLDRSEACLRWETGSVSGLSASQDQKFTRTV